MPLQFICPECGSYNIEKIPYKTEMSRSGSDKEYPPEAKYNKYECLDCGLVFFESNLRE